MHISTWITVFPHRGVACIHHFNWIVLLTPEPHSKWLPHKVCGIMVYICYEMYILQFTELYNQFIGQMLPVVFRSTGVISVGVSLDLNSHSRDSDLDSHIVNSDFDSDVSLYTWTHILWTHIWLLVDLDSAWTCESRLALTLNIVLRSVQGNEWSS